MKKRVVITGMSLVLLFIFVGVFLMITTHKKAPSEVLSKRAEEFMTKQKGKSDEVWRNIDVKGTQEALNQEIENEQCFEYTVPFVANRVVNNGECSQTVYLINPSGQLTVALGKSTAADISETSGVAFRRSKSEMYTESVISTSLGNFVTFKGLEGGFEQTAFLLKDSQILTIALTSPTNDDLSDEFEKLLQSVTLPK